MKKYVIILHQYSYGGVDTHLINLINSWKSQKDFFYIYTNPDNQGLNTIKSNLLYQNYKIIYSKGLDSFKTNFFLKKIYLFLINYIIFHRNLLAEIVKINPKAVLLNNGGFPGSIYTNLFSVTNKLLLKKEINLYLLLHHIPERNSNKFKVINFILANIIKTSKVSLITVSHASKKYFNINLGIDIKNIIYNGLDIYNFNKLKISKKVFKKNKIVLGMIGTLESHKGHEFIINVLYRLYSDGYNNFNVIIFGGDDNEKIYFNKIISKLKLNKVIFFKGYVNLDRYYLINKFDILLLPTQTFEGFGYSAAEAMLLNKVVIASNVGALPELIDDNVDGFLCNYNNEDEWYKKILFTLKNYEKLGHIRSNAKNKIMNKFDSEIMVNSYDKLFNR